MDLATNWLEIGRNILWWLWPLVAGGGAAIRMMQQRNNGMEENEHYHVDRKRVPGGYIWQEWIRNMRGNEERTRERLIAWMAEEDDKAKRGELMRLIEHCTQNLEWLQRMEDFNGGD